MEPAVREPIEPPWSSQGHDAGLTRPAPRTGEADPRHVRGRQARVARLTSLALRSAESLRSAEPHPQRSFAEVHFVAGSKRYADRVALRDVDDDAAADDARAVGAP